MLNIVSFKSGERLNVKHLIIKQIKIYPKIIGPHNGTKSQNEVVTAKIC
jgi:hypothetical protein